MPTASTLLREQLDQLAEDELLRQLKTITNPARPEITLHGHRAVDFCSNDYLGLSHHPVLIQASMDVLEHYGTSTAGARLIGGTFDLHTRLEQQLAQFKGTEGALVFNSGYQANVGVLSALAGRNDVIFSDKLNHASLLDGALLSRAKHVRYPHLDMLALEKQLQKAVDATQRFIVTDTVFSMDGDIAPLKTLFQLAQEYDAWLVMDEAHATGIFGDSHRSGLWEITHIGAHPRVIQMGTFSKALGSFGAYVAASKDVIDTLIQFSRSFVYSTSLPPAVIAANIAALTLVQQDPSYTEALWRNIHYFHHLAGELNLDLPIQSAIIPIVIGDASKANEQAKTLLSAGFYVHAIRPPTVPEDTSRLRVTLSAKHTQAQIKALVEILASLN